MRFILKSSQILHLIQGFQYTIIFQILLLGWCNVMNELVLLKNFVIAQLTF